MVEHRGFSKQENREQGTVLWLSGDMAPCIYQDPMNCMVQEGTLMCEKSKKLTQEIRKPKCGQGNLLSHTWSNIT